jgi:hypothetical protein
MASFSKPVAERSQSTLPAKRKRFLNPKLTSEDNVHEEAIKRRKHETLTNPGSKKVQKKNASTSRQTSLAFIPEAQASRTASTSTSQKASYTKSIPERQASVEEVEDDEALTVHRHAGPPKNPNAIIEAADGSDDMDVNDDNNVPNLIVVDDEEEESEDDNDEVQEETDEQELSNFFINQNSQLLINRTNLERLQKDWRSAIYAFFKTEVTISYIDGRQAHDFTCAAKSCKGRGKNPRLVRRYLDKGDRKSTGSLTRHARICWGRETVDQASGQDIDSARKALKGAIEKDGSITAVFERTGKGTITYSHRQHTKTQTRCVLFHLEACPLMYFL